MIDEGFFDLLPKMDLMDKEELPTGSKTYYLDMETNHIKGIVDNKESVIQAIILRLMTDAKVYEIFSDSYGVDVNSLIGLPNAVVENELQRRMEESLLCDDRVLSVSDFEFTLLDDAILVKCAVDTIYGFTATERRYSL